MTPKLPKMAPVDYFVSYTGVDEAWARWIVWVLEDAGYTTFSQLLDIDPARNFAIAMDAATRSARHTIAVLSRKYQQSAFAASEWTVAFAADPAGARQKLIPVRVEKFQPEGLFRPIVYIDLVGLKVADAQQRLLDGLNRGRSSPPPGPPPFPGPP